MIDMRNMRGIILKPSISMRVNGRIKSKIDVACFMCTAMTYGIGVCTLLRRQRIARLAPPRTTHTRSILPS